MNLYPSNFFEPIIFDKNESLNQNKTASLSSSLLKNNRSIFINLQKEDDEVKELLELLEGKRKYKYIIY